MISKGLSSIGPTSPSKRILSLDVLRGISLFGVLWVNIQLFSMISFLTLFFWRNAGLMLIGMALFKWGVLTAAVSKKCYRNLLIIGLAAGLPLVSLGWITNTLHNWDYEYFVTKGFHFNCWGSIFLSLAYIGGIMLMYQVKRLAVFTRSFAAVGRMAFTNYLMQTIICTTIFYGHGFGLFGKVDRTGQMILVFLIFGFQVWVSSFWLKHFRFGPFEWLWRTLTYMKIPPMRNRT